MLWRRHPAVGPEIGQTPVIIWRLARISPSQSAAHHPRTRTMTQLLRRLALFLCRREDLDSTAGLLDRSDRGFRRAVNLDGDLRLDLAAAKQPHAVLGAAQRAGLHQRLRVDYAAGIKLLGVDRLLNPVEIDLDEIEPEDVVEAALGQPPMQRHLAAFEALDAHA